LAPAKEELAVDEKDGADGGEINVYFVMPDE